MNDKIEIKDSDINIVKLNYPDNVRKRPGKLIGSTDNPDVILRETIDNCIDEIFGSTQADTIDITIPKNPDNNFYIVQDNGRGIPIYWDEVEEMTKCQLAIATLDAGSKFDKDLSKVSTGMNGVGVSCTNALSTQFIILSKITESNFDKSTPEVKYLYDNNENKSELFYLLEYSRGIKQNETAESIEDIESRYGVELKRGMSTIVLFKPDPEIFRSIEAKYPKKNLKYINIVTERFYGKSAKIYLNNELASSDFELYPMEFSSTVEVEDYNGNKKSAKFLVNFTLDDNINVSDWTGSVNSLSVDSGLHINMVKDAYYEAMKNYFNIDHEYIIYGIRANVVVIAGEVDFSSQTKERLVKLDGLRSYEVSPFLIKEFKKIFKDNLDLFENHVLKLNEYAASLEKISTINKVKSMIVVSGEEGTRVRSKIPASVKDASTKDRMKAELFICEGKSASGTIVKARNREFQAIIELRGIPLNAVNRSLEDVLENEEMRNIISAIGVGVNDYHDLSNPRYGKIIIAADADADGGKIASMILGMIAKKMTFLIREGFVYILKSALYRQGDNFIYSDEEHLLDRSKPFKRYKGLGEINTDEAEHMITNPKTRRLIQVTLENVGEALDLLTSRDARRDLMIEANILEDRYSIGLDF